MVSQLKNARNSLFLVLCLTGFFAILSSTMSKSPVLPHFAEYLQTPEGFWTGVVAVASTIPGILISLPAGTLSDILGRRKLLLVSSFVFASAPFIYLLITDWWQLILVRFYHGFSTGMFVPVAQALIAENFPAKRGERISIFSSATIIGRTLAPLLGGYILLITNYNFRTLYLAVGIASVTAFITAITFLKEKKTATERKDSKGATFRSIIHGWKSVVKTPRIFTVSLVEASQYYVYGSIDFFLIKYLAKIAVDALLQGLIMASLLMAVVLSKPFFGRLSDKIGRRTPIILGSIISAVALLWIPFSTYFPVLLLLAMVYGLGFSVVTSSTPALISELVSVDMVGSAIGLLSTVMDIGQTLGPLVCSFILVSSLEYLGLFSSLSIILLFTGLVFAVSKVAKTKGKMLS